MSISIQQLSPEENAFFELLNNVGCLTTLQAKTMLVKYLFCSDLQASRILQNLANHQYISFCANNTCITAGSRALKFAPKLDPRVIRGMHLCIDMVDSLDNMRFTHIPSDNSNLIFLAQGSLYKVIEIHADETYKINTMQQLYIDALALQKKLNGTGANPFSYVTIFTIPSSEKKCFISLKNPAFHILQLLLISMLMDMRKLRIMIYISSIYKIPKGTAK